MHCKCFEHIPCFFSNNIFDYDWIRYIFIDYQLQRVGWLVGATGAIGCLSNRSATFSIDDDNLEKIQATNQLNEIHRPNTVYIKGIGRPIKKIYIVVFKITQQHSSFGEWHPPKKPGNKKFAATSFTDMITLQCYVLAKLDFYLQLFKKLFKTATYAK